MKDTNGSARNVSGFVYHNGVKFAVPRKKHARIPPGTRKGNGTVLTFLGSRVVKEGVVSMHSYYLFRCEHGVERPVAGHRLGGCGRECRRKTPDCKWCGVDDPARFDYRNKSVCMACRQAEYRNGIRPCGKPIKKWVRPDVDVPAEHFCDQCEPWPRRQRKEIGYDGKVDAT